MSDTMESARRWSGYVCPDCRFVFRVPRDHDGKGIVCPSCRRMMRIPTAADATPPLTVTMRRMEPGNVGSEGEPLNAKKHRRGKKGAGIADHSWENYSRSSRSGKSEKNQMRLMLVGGAVLFALIVTGVAFSMNHGDKATARPVRARAELPIAATSSREPAGEVGLLAQAEPRVRKFLEARSVDELLPLVRNPAVAEGRMRKFYPQGQVDPPGLSQFNTLAGLTRLGKVMSLGVATRDHGEKTIALVETVQGLKVDWESWVGWSELSWEKFLTSRPVAGNVFRVTVSAVEYYNFGFSDESKWQSYRVVSPDGENSIYGYAEKDSGLDVRIKADVAADNAALMLVLKFPAGATSSSQVEIERYVAEGWVEEETAP